MHVGFCGKDPYDQNVSIDRGRPSSLQIVWL